MTDAAAEEAEEDDEEDDDGAAQVNAMNEARNTGNSEDWKRNNTRNSKVLPFISGWQNF